MKRALKKLVKIFQPDGFDWMNFTLSKSNPYTFHHIIEKSKGGERSIDNGAILTRKAHTFLHTLASACPDAYNDLQLIFAKINDSKKPLTQEMINEIDEVLKKVLITHEYEYLENVDLSSYCEMYSSSRKKMKKCLK